ncbi:hypothetical protein E4U59_004490 [Claviceps monticola]|nr:hypothetical protein E4U59_004490 [Claviceps monticola]
MIQAIFYARFFPREGRKIVAQSPPGSIAPSKTPTARAPFVDFDVLQEYIIPRQAFCNRYLTINSPDNKYTLLGFPIVIPDSKYQRNEFIFNFGLLIEAGVDPTPYEGVVRYLAATFSAMEKQGEYLSLGERIDLRSRMAERRPIESLLEIVKEDLNNYGECMIPVDDANTINIKLFPHHRTPPTVKAWHVPIAKVKFVDIIDPTWDLTLQKVIAYIDGVSDVRRISQLASVSLDLVKIALRHLLYYETIILIDIFFFGSCYAPRPGIHDFIRNQDGIVDECAHYVSHGPARVSNYHLIKLMAAFAPGRSVQEWIMVSQDHGFDVLNYVDVRRFVQFGVIKGCLYRVHTYPLSTQHLAALASGETTPLPASAGESLQKYTDGKHNFDQIITENNLTTDEIIDRLKTLPGAQGDLTMLYR